MPSGVRVRVPATSANLGPGLDTMGLALGLYNELTVRATADPGAAVSIDGEGAERFATGEGNLVVRSARAAFEELGVHSPGLDLRCTNRIPSARGLGSSAASIVAGVVAGVVLAGEPLDPVWALDLCARLEGHPDNVAACLLGGVTVAWYDDAGHARAVRADPAADLAAIALVPERRVSTSDARQLLPADVTLTDAAHSAGRAALLMLALTARTDLLAAATEDRLHQAYREPAMPESLALMTRLRARGLAATVSGAGPTVLVLGADARAGDASGATLRHDVERCGVEGFTLVPLAIEAEPVVVECLGS